MTTPNDPTILIPDRRIITHDNLSVTITDTTLATECAYCTWLHNRSLEAINRQRAQLGEDGYQAAIAAWSRDWGTGIYAWNAPAVRSSLNSPEHFRQLMYLIACQDAKSINLDFERFKKFFVEKQFDIEDAYIAIITRSKAVDSANPTQPGPALAAS